MELAFKALKLQIMLSILLFALFAAFNLMTETEPRRLLLGLLLNAALLFLVLNGLKRRWRLAVIIFVLLGIRSIYIAISSAFAVGPFGVFLLADATLSLVVIYSIAIGWKFRRAGFTPPPLAKDG